MINNEGMSYHYFRKYFSECASVRTKRNGNFLAKKKSVEVEYNGAYLIVFRGKKLIETDVSFKACKMLFRCL